MAAAFASACFILRIEKFSRENDAAELSGVSFVTVTTLCALWVGIDLVSPAANLARDGIGAIFSGNINIIRLDSLSLSLSLPSLQAYIVDPFLSNPWPVLYLGAFSTGVCNYLQTVGQRDIAAEKAAIIYSMDPVRKTKQTILHTLPTRTLQHISHFYGTLYPFHYYTSTPYLLVPHRSIQVYGAFFSYLFLHEELGVRGLGGAAMIMLGLWVSASAPAIDTSTTSAEDSAATAVVTAVVVDGDDASTTSQGS